MSSISAKVLKSWIISVIEVIRIRQDSLNNSFFDRSYKCAPCIPNSSTCYQLPYWRNALGSVVRSEMKHRCSHGNLLITYTNSVEVSAHLCQVVTGGNCTDGLQIFQSQFKKKLVNGKYLINSIHDLVCQLS